MGFGADKLPGALIWLGKPALRALDCLCTAVAIALAFLALPMGLGILLAYDQVLLRLPDGSASTSQLVLAAALGAFCLYRAAVRPDLKSPDPAGASPAPGPGAASGLLLAKLDSSRFLPHAILWLVWLGWVSLWWNRSFYPFDMGREPTIALLWLHNVRPYVDHFMSHHTLGGVAFFAVIIKFLGFVPYQWNLMFVVWFGFILETIYILLRRVIPARGALAITATTAIFVNYAEFTAYFQYYWQGLLVALLSAQCHAKIFTRRDRIWVMGWSTACSLFAALTLLTIPQFGIVLIIAYAVVLAARALASDQRRDLLVIVPTMLISGLVFLAAAVLAMHGLDILPGYYRWMQSLNRVTTNQFGTGSIVQTFLNWTFTVSMVKGSYLSRYSLPAGAVLVAMWFLSKAGPRQADHLRARLQYIYWGFGLAFASWLVVDFREALGMVHQYYAYIKSCPASTILLSVVMGLGIARMLGWGSQEEKTEALHWLLLVLLGTGVYFSVVQTHRSLGYALAMSIIYTPVVLAYVWFRLPKAWGFKWPRGAALALMLVMAVLGASQKILEFPYGGSWFQKWDYFQFPALRHLRAPYAQEMDRVLFMARDVARQGGKVLIYPRQITLYSLLDLMPPLPFPDLDFNLYCYPVDPQLWRQATAEIDRQPPAIIILDKRNYNATTWPKVRGDEVHIPQVVREAHDDYFMKMPSSRYQLALDGPNYFVYRLRQ